MLDAIKRWQGLRPDIRLRTAARVEAGRMLHALGLLRVGFRLLAAIDKRGRLVVLAYHKVLPRGLNETGDGVETRNFTSHLAVLREFFDLVGPEEALERRTRPRRRGEKPPMLVTFDDGYRNNLRYAFPLLQAAGVPALFFVTTGLLGTEGFIWTDEVRELLLDAPLEELHLNLQGKERTFTLTDRRSRLMASSEVKRVLKKLPLAAFTTALSELRTRSRVLHPAHDEGTLLLDWDEARIMRDGRMSFGSHSSQHRLLSRMPKEELAADVAASAEKLAKELGEAPRYFAYPNGQAADYDADVIAAVREAGFQCAFTMRRDIATAEDPAYELPRYPPEDLPGAGVALDLLLLFARALWRDLRGLALPRTPAPAPTPAERPREAA